MGAEQPAGGRLTEATVETLWDRDGERSAYQTRVKCGHFRIHIFWRGDRDPDMHDHPADFWTFPLVSYVEEIANPNLWGGAERRVVKAFRFHRRNAEFAHRVLGSFDGKYRGLSIMEWAAGFKPEPILGQRPIVTLGWWSEKRRDWGFITSRGWVAWQQYVNAPGWDRALAQQDTDHAD